MYIDCIVIGDDYIFYNNIIYMMFWAMVALLIAGLNVYDFQSQQA